MENIYLDCETLPTNDAVVKKYLLDNLSPPGNMKKAETIQAWLEDPANLKNAVHKTGLSGLFGRLACIGVALDTGDVEIIEGEELSILKRLIEVIRKPMNGGGYEQNMLIGHNIDSFDAPFINQRMLVLGLGPLFPFKTKPWDANTADTMTMFGSHNRDYIKLVDLCMALNVDKPLDAIDGSQVADAWARGEKEKVFEHCESDVIATRACYQRMVPVISGSN